MVESINFLNDGSKVLCRIDGSHNEMMMDIFVKRLKKGEAVIYKDNRKETAILLMEGKVTLKWDKNKEVIHRKNVYEEEGYCLHVCKDVEVKLVASEDSEILVQKTENEKIFNSKLYAPYDVQIQLACTDCWDSTAARIIKTFFDYNNAPYSNMVNGEIISYPGRWSSYIPHHHPQPEVYYYKFDKPQGFGACFIGDTAYMVKDGDAAMIEGGYTHPQVAAPGYRMYYCWMIRHLDGNPWTDRIDDDVHKWLYNEK